MNTTDKATVLVTGAAGNIGSAFVSALLKDRLYSVLAVDNLSTGARAKLPSNDDNFRFVKADVNDYEELSAIFHTSRFNYVFHFAAVVGVKRTLENPLSVLKDIDGIKNILSLSKNCGVIRVFFSSSSEVYGEPISIPQHEELTPLNSRLPYAIVKNLAEAYFRSYYQEHGLPYTIFRFFNTYGPNQSEDFVVPRFLRAALRNEPIMIYGDGQQTRTFCYIDDNTETMLRCLKDDLFVNDVLNVGSDIECSVLDLANLVIRLTGSRSEICFLPPLAEGDMARRQPDITKMKSIINHELVPLRDGIQRLIAHLNAQSKNEE
jgi:UDP-glucose 4-epimerase